jgi:glutamate 5-kinase
MEDLVRREVIETAETIVVKVGTNTLAREDDTLDADRITALADQLCAIRESGRKVVLVSSGAVAAGVELLSLSERPRDLPHLQASAATGQAHLIHLYDKSLRERGYHAAQMLLTGNDFKHRHRYLNVRNTLNTLFEYPVIPIVNENDTVSVDEIKFGDNDHLAAMVCNLLPNPLLIILSSVDGLYDGDPLAAGSKLISQVNSWNDQLEQLAVSTKTSKGTGGMRSKLQAVKMATKVGECVILANGHRRDILKQILAAEEVGTLFLADSRSLPAWKRWIGFTVPPKGALIADEGAVSALQQRGKSLLAIGIRAAEGDFSAGELVSVRDLAGTEIARGLSNYTATQVQQIKGKKADGIIKTLGDLPYEEVIHRDNLVVFH